MERISTAPDDVVRAVLIALCDDHETQRRALIFLDRLELRSGIRGHLPTAVAATKRKTDGEPFQICVKCHDPFLETQNWASACCFHGCDMVPVYECWLDHDERLHGPINAPENKENYPERFEWECCKLPGTESGCRKGWHKSATAKHPKYNESRSVDEPTSDEESDDMSSDDDESLDDQDETFQVGGGDGPRE